MSRRNNGTSDISITGIGVLTAVGQGKEAFLDALMEGRHAFDVMKRPGRQKGSSFIGAELSELTPPDALSKRLYRRPHYQERRRLSLYMKRGMTLN